MSNIKDWTGWLNIRITGDKKIDSDFIEFALKECSKQEIDFNSEKKYTIDDMVKIAEYGFNFRDTTQFPKHSFKDSCINNVRQYIKGVID
jgi:hypothetical protein